MDGHIEAFLEMMGAERGAASNTLVAYQDILSAFAAFCAVRGYTPAQCDGELLRSYMAGMARAGLGARTIAQRLSVLRQFFRFLQRDEVRPDDPTSLLDTPRLPRTLPQFLSEREVGLLLTAAGQSPGRRGALALAGLEILYATGLRVSELLALPRSALESDGNMVLVRGKGGKERLVPLSDAAKKAAAVLASTQHSNSHFLFPGRDPRRAMTRQTFFMLLKQVTLEAGLDPARVSPHVLRHSFASHMLARGADLRSLQLLLGHTDIATTQIYTHVLGERLQRLVKAHHLLAQKALSSHQRLSKPHPCMDTADPANTIPLP